MYLAQFPFRSVYFDEALKMATTRATEYSRSDQIKMLRGAVREKKNAYAVDSKSYGVQTEILDETRAVSCCIRCPDKYL